MSFVSADDLCACGLGIEPAAFLLSNDAERECVALLEPLWVVDEEEGRLPCVGEGPAASPFVAERGRSSFSRGVAAGEGRTDDDPCSLPLRSGDRERAGATAFFTSFSLSFSFSAAVGELAPLLAFRSFFFSFPSFFSGLFVPTPPAFPGLFTFFSPAFFSFFSAFFSPFLAADGLLVFFSGEEAAEEAVGERLRSTDSSLMATSVFWSLVPERVCTWLTKGQRGGNGNERKKAG